MPTSVEVSRGEMREVRWEPVRVWALKPVVVVPAPQRAVARLGFARFWLGARFCP